MKKLNKKLKITDIENKLLKTIILGDNIFTVCGNVGRYFLLHCRVTLGDNIFIVCGNI